ncbi:MAG: hypothetical protein CMK07_04315 [Ponticaulis sp.]|nr:hypothetical protein [Ponticaulis sp.]
MALWNIRNLISIAAGVSASAVAVRKALGREVDRRADKAIAAAVVEARTEIREQAHKFFSRGFIQFFWTALVKASLILAVASVFLMGWVADHWSALALAVLFVVFTTYDAVRAFPTAKFVWDELRKYGWRPKRILSETISAQVFESVLERAQEIEVKKSENILLLLAGRKRNEIVDKMARGVADIAAQTSWDDIKPMLFGFAVRCGILMLIYSSLVWTLIWMIRH